MRDLLVPDTNLAKERGKKAGDVEASETSVKLLES